MFKDRIVAEKISTLMLEIAGQLDESVTYVVENCSAEEASAYAQVVGNLMATIGLDVLNEIYGDYPEIKPDEYSM